LAFGTVTDVLGAKVEWDFTNAIVKLATSFASGSVQLCTGNDVSALYINSSQDVHIGGTAATARLHVTDTGLPNTLLESSDAGANPGPLLDLWRNSSTPLADDHIGGVQFSGQDAGTGKEPYADIVGRIVDPTDTSEDGAIEHRVSVAGTMTSAIRTYSTGATHRTLLGDTSGLVADGTVHVMTASAGSVAAPSTADDFIVENSAAGGISILTPDAGAGKLSFSTPSAVDGARITWDQALNVMTVGTNVAGAQLRFTTATGTEQARIDASGKMGLGTTSPDGTLHVHAATAGTVTADTTADDLVVENSAAGGISILTPDAAVGGIVFGSPTDSIGAAFTWQLPPKRSRLKPIRR
jgi:hypothetical protein